MQLPRSSTGFQLAKEISLLSIFLVSLLTANWIVFALMVAVSVLGLYATGFPLGVLCALFVDAFVSDLVEQLF